MDERRILKAIADLQHDVTRMKKDVTAIKEDVAHMVGS